MSRTVVAVLALSGCTADTFDEIARELPPEYDDLLAPSTGTRGGRGTVGS